ncbi:MAG: Hint domain-containing protein [Paracoccaceae bacterium]
MAEFHLFAWKMSDFGDTFQAQMCGTECDASFSIGFNPNSEPVLVLVNDGADGSDYQNQVVLAKNFVQCGEVFPAGSAINVEYSGEIAGSADNKLFVCAIERPFKSAGDDSNRLVFTTTALQAGQSYTITNMVPKFSSQDDSVNFARGTLIDTPHGPLAIERLEEGDEVLTRDGGIQLIKRVAMKRYSGLELVLNPQLRPVCIQAGALLGGLPGTDLIVAQRHRLLLNDWRAAYLFGEEEILVPAKSLLNGRNVTVTCPETGIDYLQLELDQPDLISANGLWAEACTRDHDVDQRPTANILANENSEHISYIDEISDGYTIKLPALPTTSAPSLAA